MKDLIFIFIRKKKVSSFIFKEESSLLAISRRIEEERKYPKREEIVLGRKQTEELGHSNQRCPSYF